MEQQPRALSDDELRSLFDSDADLSLLTQEEQQRLLKLTEAQPAAEAEPSFKERMIAKVEADPLIQGAASGGIMSIGPQAVEGTRRLITGLARRMYQGALKPTKAVVSRTPGGEAALAETGLREGLTVSRGGVEKATNLISELDDAVTQAIQGSNATVSRNAVSQRLNDTFDTFSRQVNPQGDLQQIRNVGRNFRRANPAQMPVQRAQELKQGTYKAQAKKYGQQAGAESEAEKTLARGLKEEISRAVPEVEPLNSRQAQIIQVRKALEDATRRTGNRDTIGLTDVIAATSNPRLLAATIGMRAVPQSLAARALNRTGQSDVSPEVLQAAVRALIAGQSQDE
jgi:hypothetical protein